MSDEGLGVHDEVHAALEKAAADFERSTGPLREVYARLKELTHTSRSSNGMVTVTVGAHGQVVSISLDPRVYRKLSPSELADAIAGQIAVASRQVSARVREVVEPLMPDGLRYEEIFGAGASLEAFFSAPMSAPRERA
ncbi:YbaB/EbfC family nucleoid-associated protein [[Actinomadura] parvosata]|uniref:YbaB/EbfC family nucleoid-associated protein n=1 Tax=[Actinomadura] parvosata TaxID=1955412 RepID=UPI00164676AD